MRNCTSIRHCTARSCWRAQYNWSPAAAVSHGAETKWPCVAAANPPTNLFATARTRKRGSAANSAWPAGNGWRALLRGSDASNLMQLKAAPGHGAHVVVLHGFSPRGRATACKNDTTASRSRLPPACNRRQNAPAKMACRPPCPRTPRCWIQWRGERDARWWMTRTPWSSVRFRPIFATMRTFQRTSASTIGNSTAVRGVRRPCDLDTLRGSVRASIPTARRREPPDRITGA